MSTEKSYSVVNDRIISALEAGTVPWRKPWVGGSNHHQNPFTPTIYKGINPLMLQMAAWDEGYSDCRWGTFRQIVVQRKAKLINAKGKGVPVVFWNWVPSKKIDPATGERKLYPYLNYSRVFNLKDHTDLDLPDLDPNVVPEEPHAKAEKLFLGIKHGPSISYGHDRAAYAPITDHIGMPDRKQFHSEAEFHSTRFHEVIHWTGAEHRLDRFKPAEGQFTFGSESYSKEELTAEIGACYLNSHCGVETEESFENSTAYLASWIRKLKKDSKLLVGAASAAQKACDLVIGEDI